MSDDYLFFPFFLDKCVFSVRNCSQQD